MSCKGQETKDSASSVFINRCVRIVPLSFYMYFQIFYKKLIEIFCYAGKISNFGIN